MRHDARLLTLCAQYAIIRVAGTLPGFAPALQGVSEQHRIALALALVSPPYVLLFDDPTHHLSITVIKEYKDALRSAPGAWG